MGQTNTSAIYGQAPAQGLEKGGLGVFNQPGISGIFLKSGTINRNSLNKGGLFEPLTPHPH